MPTLLCTEYYVQCKLRFNSNLLPFGCQVFAYLTEIINLRFQLWYQKIGKFRLIVLKNLFRYFQFSFINKNRTVFPSFIELFWLLFVLLVFRQQDKNCSTLRKGVCFELLKYSLMAIQTQSSTGCYHLKISLCYQKFFKTQKQTKKQIFHLIFFTSGSRGSVTDS